eukprot:Skav230792  [mRNA]  locus=scaffold312:103074:108500:+ [translate_table: standard]
MAAFQPGQVCYIAYGEVPRLLHTRIILGHIQGHEYLIRTPDGDEYPEEMDPSNIDASEFHVGPDDGSIPAAMAGARIYGFQPMTVAELNAILAAGRVEAALERRRRGIAAPVDVAAPQQLVWVLAEWIPGKKIGEQVNPPAGFVRDGVYGLMQMDDAEGVRRPVLIHQCRVDEVADFCGKRIDAARKSEAAEGDDMFCSEDVRTLEVKFGVNGDRHRGFRETILEMQQVEFDDFPLEPRTSLSYLKAVANVSESAFGQHLGWVQQSKIPDGDRAIHEDETIARAIDLAISYDALNVCNLASFELLIRRRQLLADAHTYNPSAPSYEGSDHYMGTTYRPGGAIVVPELVKHVSDRMHLESQILKERRKQAELKGKGRGAGPTCHQRSLFPLPHLKGVGVLGKAVSSSVLRRLHRREHIRERVNMAIDAMNSLYYGKELPTVNEVDDLSSLSMGQRECVRSIVQKVAAFGAPPLSASRQGALKALRATSGGYVEPEAGVGDVVDLDLSCLSLPAGQVAGVVLGDSLEEPLAEMVKDFETWMLQDSDTWSSICDQAYKIKPYDDPSLKDRAKYISFLQHLHGCGILGTTSCCQGRVGTFCVSKKPKVVEGQVKQRQRLILDCRQVNLQFREPPHCELGALSALGEIVLEEGQVLYASGSDIQDCFYAARISDELSSFFCLLPDLSLHEAQSIFGPHFQHSPGSRISPCITVLPMGFSWSFYLIQKLHEQSALRSLQVERSQLILDGYPSPSLTGDAVVAMPYCDNVHSLSLSREACQRGKDLMCEDLSMLGFTLHEDVDATDYFQTLGGIIDGKVGVVKPTPSRAWNIVLAFESLLDSPVDWMLLRRLLGHAMTICTLNRSGMSIFRALYDYVEAAPKPRMFNKKERREVLNFVGLVPLLVCEMRRPWHTDVTCTDASPSGFGICQTTLDKQSVQEMGKWQDRWRFRHLDPAEWRPRMRTQGLDPIRDAATSCVSSKKYTIEDLYAYNNYFPEIPARTKMMGKWGNTQEHITQKEGRALVLAVKRLCRSTGNRGHRHLVLVDSFALCMAICKGRASNFKLLRVTQQIAALSLAGGFTVRTRWIASESNVADGPSRGQLNPGPYKAYRGSCDEQAEEPQAGEVSEPQVSSPTFQQQSTIAGASGPEGPTQDSEASSTGSKRFEAGCPEELEQSENSDTGSRQACSWEQADHFGEEIGFKGYREPVCQLLSEVREFLPSQRFGASTRFKDRRPVGGIHGPHVLGGQRRQRGRKNPRCHQVPPLCPQGAHGKEQEGPSGLEERSSPAEPNPNSDDHCLWDQHGATVQEEEGDGVESHLGLRHIHASWRKLGSEEEECSGPSEESGSPVQVVLDSGSRFRREKARQGWSLRQQHPFGQFKQDVDWQGAIPAGSHAQPEGGQDLRVLHGRVPQGVHSCREPTGSQQPPSISTQAWGCSRRPQQPISRSPWCQEQGKVEHRCVSAQIHEGGKDSATYEPSLTKKHGVLSLVSSKPRESVPGPHPTKESLMAGLDIDILNSKSLPHKFALEVFAGTARVTLSLQQKGIQAFPIDICLFGSHNVLNTKVEHKIFNWIRTGRVSFLWCGMPCTSFSRARKWDGLGPGPLRTEAELWGLSDLSAADRKKVNNGNSLLWFSLRMLRLCESHGVPYTLENPFSSMAWIMPPMKKFISRYNPGLLTLDFCQYGEAWKKPTTLMFNYINLYPLALRCTTIGHRCSRSKRPHIHLAGRDETGIFMTLRAQPYPWELAGKVASSVAQILG